MSYMKTKNNKTITKSNEKKDNSLQHTSWTAAQFCLMNINSDIKNKVLLDSGSSTSIFCNQKYC